MRPLPAEFIGQTRQLLGAERFGRYMQSFDEEAPVSIRLNPKKPCGKPVGGQPVPWCRNAWYLTERPNFTFDPLLHAGCYYVQEASSMFFDTILRQYLPDGPVMALDLCAAPGGKSTLLRAALSDDSVLCSNEPVRNRAQVLSENLQKWGNGDCLVTNSLPRDYRKSGLRFGVVLCDVPCSGEGMFRKDEATIGEWSLAVVEKCSRLQRDIVADAWECLEEGGLMVYSTCTLNTRENEENVRWMVESLGAEVLPVAIDGQWNITGSLLPGFTLPVYRFIPGLTRGEGLFMAALRKPGSSSRSAGVPALSALSQKVRKALNILSADFLESLMRTEDCPVVALSYGQAIAFLRREALTLPHETPRGIVVVEYEGHRLGLMKNVGSRANNLYPKEWRIKSTYLPATPPKVVEVLNC